MTDKPDKQCCRWCAFGDIPITNEAHPQGIPISQALAEGADELSVLYPSRLLLDGLPPNINWGYDTSSERNR